MTAYDARNLMKDFEKLNFIERLREIWICGRINELMYKKCRRGKDCLTVKFTSDFGKRVHRRIENYYKEQGYDTKIWYYDDYIRLGIGWKE